jgi:hypothetical protein
MFDEHRWFYNDLLANPGPKNPEKKPFRRRNWQQIRLKKK